MKVVRKNLIREGKAKILYETDRAGFIIQHFKDDATAFNAQKKGQIRNKGILNNAVSALLFRHLEKHGVRSHFVESTSEREMLTRLLKMIPVEFVVRNRATGSIVDRLGIERGRSFNPPLVEYFLKSDDLGDPLVGETHIAYFRWATSKQLEFAREQSLRVNELLRPIYDQIGLELIDFKLEFGVGERGEILLADELTPDGCRLWDKETGEPMDKDRFRHDLGGVEDAYLQVFHRLETFFKKAL